MSDIPEYAIWKTMIQRCESEKHKSYKDYGARGVAVCERWRSSFDNFILDMGTRPSALHSIDRKNGELGYSPENCHWATKAEQSNNRRSTVKLTFYGITKSATEWSGISLVAPKTILKRLKSGCSHKEAVWSQPGYLKGAMLADRGSR